MIARPQQGGKSTRQNPDTERYIRDARGELGPILLVAQVVDAGRCVGSRRLARREHERAHAEYDPHRASRRRDDRARDEPWVGRPFVDRNGHRRNWHPGRDDHGSGELGAGPLHPRLGLARARKLSRILLELRVALERGDRKVELTELFVDEGQVINEIFARRVEGERRLQLRDCGPIVAFTIVRQRFVEMMLGRSAPRGGARLFVVWVFVIRTGRVGDSHQGDDECEPTPRPAERERNRGRTHGDAEHTPARRARNHRAQLGRRRSILTRVDAASPQKLNTTALLAAISGVLGFCFWGIGGVLAIVLGITARTEIARSAGRETGNAAAISGIVLGALNIASCVIGIAVGIAYVARPAPAPAAVAAPALPVPAAPAPSARPPRRAQPGNATREQTRREGVLGSVRVVDAAAGSGKSLRRVLESEQRAASLAGERLVVYVAGPNCLPCNGVMLSLSDARLQRALGRARLLRVDASEFGADLVALGVPAETVPGFALLGPGQRVVDYIDGGEWDADIPENIAPVLGAFVSGKYRTRRRSFQGEERADQTVL